MAVVNTKSTAITNLDATPPVLTNRALSGCFVQCSIGTVEVAAADSDTSTFRFVRLPSNAVIHSIQIACDAITAGTSYDIGLYDVAGVNSGAVIDADLFASAIDLSSAIAFGGSGSEVRWEAGTTGDLGLIEYRLWQLADAGAATLTADPVKQYDIVATANTVGSGAGTICLRVWWSV